jgi:hypothetical protein
MSALRKYRRFGLISRWLAVVAMLLPLLLPMAPGEAGTFVSRATVSVDIFTAELCSVTHAVDGQGNGQSPVDHHDQHCPLCISIQQIGSCLTAESSVSLAAIDFVGDDPSSRPAFVNIAIVYSSTQPRAPPVRV